MHVAATACDVESYARCMDPRVQAPAKLLLVSSARLRKTVRATAAAVELNIGEALADKVRELGVDCPLVSPLSDAAAGGRVDWSKVAISQREDRATVKVAGQPLPVTLRKYGEQWRAVPPAAEVDAARYLRYVKEVAASNDALADRLKELTTRVQARQVNRDNFQVEFAKARNGPAPKEDE
jgi:hypothetical protein